MAKYNKIKVWVVIQIIIQPIIYFVSIKMNAQFIGGMIAVAVCSWFTTK